MESTDKNQKTLLWVLVGIIIVALVVIILMSFYLVRGRSPESTATATPTLTATPLPTATPVPTATQIPPPAVTDPVWERIQNNGKMNAGISADYPPFAFLGKDFQFAGFDIAVVTEIGRRMNLGLDLRNLAFDGLGNALQLEQIDLAIAAISITPERQAVVDFSNVYYVGEDAALAQRDSNIRINRVEDLAQYRVGVQSGSVYESWLDETLVEPGLMPPQKLRSFQTAKEAVAALSGGSQAVDIVILDALPAEVAERENPVKIIAQGLNTQRFAIAIPKGAFELQANINNTLTQMQNDGTMNRLARQYLDVDQLIPPATPPPATPEACLDHMTFIEDLNFPDNNMKNPPEFQPGESFQKGWRIKNSGTCTWDSSYALTYRGSNPPNAPVGGNPVAVQGKVVPGQEYDIYVNISAPYQPGVFQSFWSMRSPSGMFFGEQVYAGFEVTGQPTQVPPQSPVIYTFDADPNHINEGGCVNLNWRFDGQDLTLTRIFRDDQVILQDVPYSGNAQDCPPGTGTVTYRLVVDSEFGGSAKTKQDINIIPFENPTPTPPPEPEQPPVIAAFNANPDQIDSGDCIELSWSFSGTSLAQAQIFRDGQTILSDAPVSGNLEDCPPAPGHVEYLLQVDSEFSGSAQASQFIDVYQPRQGQLPEIPPQIDYFEANPTQLYAGDELTLRWSFQGTSLTAARILQNEQEIAADIPNSGDLRVTIDPGLEGSTVTYTLIIDSEFSGSDRVEVQVEVLPAQG